MTPERLLEAMGLLDDDLIAQAEEPVRRKSAFEWKRWAALAACLALVVAISYGAGRLGWGGGSSNGSSGTGATDSPTASAGGGEQAPGDPESGAAGDSSSNLSQEVLIVIVQADGRVWSYQHWYGEDRVLDTLPQGCRSLGEVGTYVEGEDCVYTDMGEFPGCPLWIVGDGWDGPVYLELPEGGYLECR